MIPAVYGFSWRGLTDRLLTAETIRLFRQWLTQSGAIEILFMHQQAANNCPFPPNSPVFHRSL